MESTTTPTSNGQRTVVTGGVHHHTNLQRPAYSCHGWSPPPHQPPTASLQLSRVESTTTPTSNGQPTVVTGGVHHHTNLQRPAYSCHGWSPPPHQPPTASVQLSGVESTTTPTSNGQPTVVTGGVHHHTNLQRPAYSCHGWSPPPHQPPTPNSKPTVVTGGVHHHTNLQRPAYSCHGLESTTTPTSNGQPTVVTGGVHHHTNLQRPTVSLQLSRVESTTTPTSNGQRTVVRGGVHHHTNLQRPAYSCHGWSPPPHQPPTASLQLSRVESTTTPTSNGQPTVVTGGVHHHTNLQRPTLSLQLSRVESTTTPTSNAPTVSLQLSRVESTTTPTSNGQRTVVRGGVHHHTNLQRPAYSCHGWSPPPHQPPTASLQLSRVEVHHHTNLQRPAYSCHGWSPPPHQPPTASVQLSRVESTTTPTSNGQRTVVTGGVHHHTNLQRPAYSCHGWSPPPHQPPTASLQLSRLESTTTPTCNGQPTVVTGGVHHHTNLQRPAYSCHGWSPPPHQPPTASVQLSRVESTTTPTSNGQPTVVTGGSPPPHQPPTASLQLSRVESTTTPASNGQPTVVTGGVHHHTNLQRPAFHSTTPSANGTFNHMVVGHLWRENWYYGYL